MGRTIIVGDVHGCGNELKLLLDDVRFERKDRLVFVGDIVVRGPDSLGVLDVAHETGAVLVRGNHEEKLVKWRAYDQATRRGEPAKEVTLGKAHAQVARNLRDADWALIEQSPVYLKLPEHGALVVHAGLEPGVPLEDQKRGTMLKIRTVLKDGTPSDEAGHALWGAVYRGPPHVVFGHNAAPGLQLHPWATGLDTGCVYGGRLTAMVLEENQAIPADPTQRRRLLTSHAAARPYFELHEA